MNKVEIFVVNRSGYQGQEEEKAERVIEMSYI